MNLKKIFFFIMMMVFIPIVNAGSFSASSSDLNPNVGDKVVITVKTNDAAGYFKITSSDSSILSGGGTTDFLDNSSATISFSAKKAGSVTVTITPSDCAGYDEVEITSPKKITINVKEKVVSNNSTNNQSGTTTTQKTTIKSSINYLSSLSIDGVELTPAFDKDTTEYDITLPSGTTSIHVNGDLESSSSYVTGLGDISVSEGVNFISIVVTAENGAKKTYNIRANVLEESPIIVNINNEDKTLIRKNESMPSASDYYSLSTVKIDDNEVPAYISDITGDTLVALKDSEGTVKLYKYDSEKNAYVDYNELVFNSIRISVIDIPELKEGYSLGSVAVNNIEVQALIKDDSLPLIYGINLENGEKNFYSFDSTENTIQKFKFKEDKNDKKKYYPYIIIGLCGLCLFEFIVIICVVISKNKKMKKILRKKLNEKTEYENTFESKNNIVFKDEKNITDDLTDEYMNSSDELGHTAMISNSVTNVFDNSVNRKELKKKKFLRKKNKKDDDMYNF